MSKVTTKSLNELTHKELELQYLSVAPTKTKKEFIKNILEYLKEYGEFTGDFVGEPVGGHKPDGTVDDLYDALDDAKSGNEEWDENKRKVYSKDEQKIIMQNDEEGLAIVDDQNEAEGDRVESEDYLKEGSEAQKVTLEDMAEKSEEQEAKIKMKVSEQEYKLLEHKQNDYEGYTMMTHGKKVRGGVIYKELVLRGGGAAVHTIFLPGFRLEQSTKDKDLMVLVK